MPQMAHVHRAVGKGWHQRQRNPWNPSLSAHKSSFSLSQRWKAWDNRGIPTAVLSVVGSWQLTQVGVGCCLSFEGCLLKGKATSVGSVPCFGPGGCFWEVTRGWVSAQLFRKSEVAVKRPTVIQRLPGKVVSLKRVAVWEVTLICVFFFIRGQIRLLSSWLLYPLL